MAGHIPDCLNKSSVVCAVMFVVVHPSMQTLSLMHMLLSLHMLFLSSIQTLVRIRPSGKHADGPMSKEIAPDFKVECLKLIVSGKFVESGKTLAGGV